MCTLQTLKSLVLGAHFKHWSALRGTMKHFKDHRLHFGSHNAILGMDLTDLMLLNTDKNNAYLLQFLLAGK